MGWVIILISLIISNERELSHLVCPTLGAGLICMGLLGHHFVVLHIFSGVALCRPELKASDYYSSKPVKWVMRSGI